MEHLVQQHDTAQQAIDATNRRFEATFLTGDHARAVRDTYTRDARVLPPGAPPLRGRETAVEFWEAAAQQLGIREVRLETVDLEIHGDHAHEIGQGTLVLDGGQRVVAKYVVIWKQEDGEWRWDVDIWNTDT